MLMLCFLPAYSVNAQDTQSDISSLEKQINSYIAAGNDKEAMRITDEAIEKYPQEADFYYLKGMINNSKGRYERALGNFDKAIDLKSPVNMYKFYLGRGVSHSNLLEYDLALTDLSAAIEMNDTVAGAYHSRAMVYYETHDYSLAVSDFLKALQYTAGNAAIYFNLGMSYYRLDEKDKACPYFHKACTLGNTNACRMALMECAKAIPVVP
jgi:tetratricopeptide (TPR) repeat protein